MQIGMPHCERSEAIRFSLAVFRLDMVRSEGVKNKEDCFVVPQGAGLLAMTGKDFRQNNVGELKES